MGAGRQRVTPPASDFAQTIGVVQPSSEEGLEAVYFLRVGNRKKS